MYKKDKKYWDRYISYLCQIAYLNRTKKLNFINDKEYIKLKKIFIKKYNIEDHV